MSRFTTVSLYWQYNICLYQTYDMLVRPKPSMSNHIIQCSEYVCCMYTQIIVRNSVTYSIFYCCCSSDPQQIRIVFIEKDNIHQCKSCFVYFSNVTMLELYDEQESETPEKSCQSDDRLDEDVCIYDGTSENKHNHIK